MEVFRGVLTTKELKELLALLLHMGSGEAYSPPQVDRIWAIWGSYCNIPKTIFYLLKGHYNFVGLWNGLQLLSA